MRVGQNRAGCQNWSTSCPSFAVAYLAPSFMVVVPSTSRKDQRNRKYRQTTIASVLSVATIYFTSGLS